MTLQGWGLQSLLLRSSQLSKGDNKTGNVELEHREQWALGLALKGQNKLSLRKGHRWTLNQVTGRQKWWRARKNIILGRRDSMCKGPEMIGSREWLSVSSSCPEYGMIVILKPKLLGGVQIMGFFWWTWFKLGLFPFEWRIFLAQYNLVRGEQV